MAKGAIAKEEVVKKISEAFGSNFIGEFDMTYANLTDSIINREGSFLVALPNGCIRIYEEDYITISIGYITARFLQREQRNQCSNIRLY